MQNLRYLTRHIPNFLTLLSLCGGMLAIIFAFSGSLFFFAPYMLMICAVFDFLDGFSARLFHAYSDAGRELDSLADVVSFGIAPGILMFKMLEFSFNGTYGDFQLESANTGQWVLLATAFALPVFSAIRLARFNLDTTQKTSFKGLPTPASGLLVAFLFLFLTGNGYASLQSLMAHPAFLAATTLALSFLMVSNLRLLSLKFQGWDFRSNAVRYFLLIAGIILLVALHALGGLLTIVLYVLLSMVFPPKE